MSKYDFEIDLSDNSSTGVILQKINRGASVLEFGCAAGRMTRYMKEELDCRVCIVEYDAEAYDKARQYAEAGICGDIMDMQWREAFGEKRFDAILFADVLEHLPDPEKILRSASELLADKGCLYVSLPNITHNDILLKAWEERFDYTATGLLDDTHVHFWGLENLKTLAQNCGLSLRKIEATYCPTGYTEQYAGRERQKDLLLENLLRQRQGGEVYQFVLTLDKSGEAETVCTVTAPSVQSHIYLNTGKGINAEQVIAVDSRYSGHGSYLTHYVIEETEKLQQIRFDPLEFQGCMIRQLTVSQNGKQLPLIYPNAVELETGVFLPGDDPMVYVDVLSGGPTVEISAEFLIPGKRYLAQAETAVVHQNAEKMQLQQEKFNLQNEKVMQEKEKTILLYHNKSLTFQNEKLVAQRAAMIDQNEQQKRDLSGYVTLVNKKEIILLNLEREIEGRNNVICILESDLKSKEAHIQAQERELAERRRYILELEQAVNYYQSLRVVKFRAFIGRILRGIKRRIMRVMKK